MPPLFIRYSFNYTIARQLPIIQAIYSSTVLRFKKL